MLWPIVLHCFVALLVGARTSLHSLVLTPRLGTSARYATSDTGAPFACCRRYRSNCLNTPHGWSSWTGAMHYALYLATADKHYLFNFLTNLTASLAAFVSPHSNGLVYYMYTPDPTITNPAGDKVAGCCQLDVPSGEQLRGNMTGEPFEVVKLMHDTVLAHAHIYWHGDAWRAIGATLRTPPCSASSGGGGVPRLMVAPKAGISTVYINYASAAVARRAEGSPASSVVFELAAASAAGVGVEMLHGSAGDGGCAGKSAAVGVGVECEDEGWLLA